MAAAEEAGGTLLWKQITAWFSNKPGYSEIYERLGLAVLSTGTDGALDRAITQAKADVLRGILKRIDGCAIPLEVGEARRAQVETFQIVDALLRAQAAAHGIALDAPKEPTE